MGDTVPMGVSIPHRYYKSVVKMNNEFIVPEFQFLIGIINLDPRDDKALAETLFQFLIGIINRYL